ncbi:hypothetical protein IWQ60_009421 [Tieghemiomyces parasiticus]|uniref:WH1 domain-containing protein n=1 Tax=Tieghemiomyces parasiticus TaxID=78921 RepID=A0A9W7ZN43_9FUNG|nr:hypothetical protein IWQ60_009421 [Tieghemiomyces parasiticus]
MSRKEPKSLRRAKDSVNLNVLQRHDAAITKILDQSSHVVIYQFDAASGGWTKKGVEGTLFLFQRNRSPYYGFFVMNRLALTNFCAFLRPTLEVQPTTDFIIFRDTRTANVPTPRSPASPRPRFSEPPSPETSAEESLDSAVDDDSADNAGEAGLEEYIFTSTGDIVPATSSGTATKPKKSKANSAKSRQPATSSGRSRATSGTTANMNAGASAITTANAIAMAASADSGPPPDNNIYAVWVYETADRERIGAAMSQLRTLGEQPPPMSPSVPARAVAASDTSAAPTSGAETDAPTNHGLLGMLERARQRTASPAPSKSKKKQPVGDGAGSRARSPAPKSTTTGQDLLNLIRGGGGAGKNSKKVDPAVVAAQPLLAAEPASAVSAPEPAATTVTSSGLINQLFPGMRIKSPTDSTPVQTQIPSSPPPYGTAPNQAPAAAPPLAASIPGVTSPVAAGLLALLKGAGSGSAAKAAAAAQASVSASHQAPRAQHSNASDLLAALKGGVNIAAKSSAPAKTGGTVAVTATSPTQSPAAHVPHGSGNGAGFPSGPEHSSFPVAPLPSHIPPPSFPMMMPAMSHMHQPPPAAFGPWPASLVNTLLSSVPPFVAQQQQQQQQSPSGNRASSPTVADPKSRGVDGASTAPPPPTSTASAASASASISSASLLTPNEFQIQVLHALQTDSQLMDHLYRDYCHRTVHFPNHGGMLPPQLPSHFPPHHHHPHVMLPVPPQFLPGMSFPGGPPPHHPHQVPPHPHMFHHGGQSHHPYSPSGPMSMFMPETSSSAPEFPSNHVSAVSSAAESCKAE